MADEKRKKYSKDESKSTEVFVPQSTNQIQKRKIEKLMKNPDKLVNIPSGPKEWKPSDPKDFVRFVMGSSAGAGSGEFHVYRSTRRREYNRQRYINEKAKEEEANDEFCKKLEENKSNAEERTAKKRAKRLKKKQRKQDLKKSKSDNKNDGDEQTTKQNASENEQNSEDQSDEEPAGELN